MSAVITKDDVRFGLITMDLVVMLRALVRVSDHPTVPYGGLVITAGSDGTHMHGSRHYTGQALDLRSHTFEDAAAKREFMAVLQQELGPRYSVILESETLPNEHFHVQVRKGVA